MTSFCLQITRRLYGNIAASYVWKVTVAKNFAALLRKLNTSFFVNFYDV